tara:strand:+ start:111 stop:326 length:216 start_codon:yes stop_codon:yes gene_type:complete
MFKIIAIVCAFTYGGHIMECTKMTETDKRVFHNEVACLDDAQIKYNQIATALETRYPDEYFTLKVYCEEVE